MGAAVADVKSAWKAENQALATTGATAFTVTVILPVQITNKASGVALDFVIQGIDYNAFPEAHKHTFAADLIKELQTGVWNTFPIARGGVTKKPEVFSKFSLKTLSEMLSLTPNMLKG